MAITEMSLVKIIGNIKFIDETMTKCCNFGLFHPEQATLLEEYKDDNEKFLDYSKDTGYLRRIVDLAEKLGLGTFKNKIPELEKFESRDFIERKDISNNFLDENMRSQAYFNPYDKLLKECHNIFSMVGIKPREVRFRNLDISLEDIQNEIDKIKTKGKYMLDQKVIHEQKISEYTAVLTQLENIDSTNINFDELFSCKFLKIRFGRLPKESYEKLKIIDNENFILFSFKDDMNYRWCLYITPCYNSKAVDEIFNSLFFERIRIPVYAHGTPVSTKNYVKNQIGKCYSMIKYIDNELKILRNYILKSFMRIYSRIKFFNQCFENKKFAAVFDDQFYIIGFIPKDAQHSFFSLFRDLRDIDITIYDPMSDERLKTPVKLKNNRFSAPFEDFVAMYGLPSYKDIDPTVFLSISYTLLFGIMFGDMGQGLIIALLGFILSRFRRSNFLRILTRIGLSSMFFGFIYGSCFGYEGLFENYLLMLPEPYQTLLLKISHKDTNTLLISAIFIGVIAIISSMIFNICVGVKHKKSSIYLFGQNGLAGLIFYISIILAVVEYSILKINVFSPWFIIFCLILPLLIIFLRGPLGNKLDGRKIQLPDGIGGFIIENFFELYDVLLGFLSNTISFIRVGAFVLSHAGMMAVIMGFMHSLSVSGKVILLVFGNILVIAFEGLIVGIQALRLQFYEMFSRCFDGEGKPFKNI